MRIETRAACADEAALLSDLALRSKAHWGYDERFLEACRADLTLRPAEIGARRVVVAEVDGRVAGFYTLDGEPPEGELGNLWIDPAYLRRGIGRALWQHAMTTAQGLGFRAVLIDADPHAEAFYLAMGAVRVGDAPSTAIPGRVLPRLRATCTTRLWKVKRPGGVYWFDLQEVARDRDGTWLRGPVGSRWGAPHDSGTLPVPVVVWLATGRPWAAWWVDDPADRRLEIDVCLPPESSDAGWRYVDLELDPVLHERDGRVEIEDWDEFDEACRNGWMSPDDAELARVTAEQCAEVLRRRSEPWLRRGWRI